MLEVTFRGFCSTCILYSVRLWRCSFYTSGQCESLYQWIEQRIQAFTLFILTLNRSDTESLKDIVLRIMLHLFKRAVVIMMALCMSLTSGAYDFKDGDCYYTITSLSDLTVALTNDGGEAACYHGDFTVPQTAQYMNRTFKVTSIDASAFRNCYLDKLTIPPSILSVSENLVLGSVQRLIIECGNTPLILLGRLSGYVKEVYMGRNIDRSFDHLSSFFEKSNVEKVEFGNSVTFVPDYAFYKCTELKSVSFSSSIERIGYSAFSGCTKLSLIDGGENILNLGHEAFRGCTSLESIDFPNLTTISGYAFVECTKLKNLELHDGLLIIKESAFKGCESLEKVGIPESIIIVGASAFADCSKLSEISIADTNPIDIVESVFDVQTYLNAKLKVSVGSLDAYKQAAPWSNFVNIEEDPSLTAYSTCTIKVYTNFEKDTDSVKFLGNIIGWVYHYDSTWANGSMVFVAKVKKGELVNIKFNPNFGNYYIKDLIVNQENVTSKVVDNTFRIGNVESNLKIEVWFGYGDSSIPTVASDRPEAQVIGADGKIVVNNASEGETISVYSLSGMLIYSAISNNTATTIDVPANRVYIVRVGATSYKVAL